MSEVCPAILQGYLAHKKNVHIREQPLLTLDPERLTLNSDGNATPRALKHGR